MADDNPTTPDPTPALLSAARLAEIRERVAAGKFEHTMSDRAALLAHLAALTPPAAPIDREAGGCLVREVWIAWAKEQPSPKPSWLVPWEGLSEPDREVDRRIFEACYAAGRASLDALTPRAAPDGEALGAEVRRIRGEFTWGEALRKEEEAEDRAIGLALHAIGYAAGRSEGEAERAHLAEEVANLRLVCSWDPMNPLDLVEARAEIASLRARLTAERDAIAAELAEARAVVTDRERKRGYLVGAIKSLWRSRDDARRDGAREERALHDDLATAAAALVESLGEYVRQSMTANPEWSSGIKQIEAALFARKKRARGEWQGS